MPRLALVLLSLLLALMLGCTPQPPSRPATPAAPDTAATPATPDAPATPAEPVAPATPPAIGAPNPLDRPAPPRPVGAVPAAPNRSCKTDADCVVKDVGNCCGYYPACVNVDAKTDPQAVQAQCARSGTAGVCGFPEISGCQCVKGQCAADARGSLI